MLRSNENHGYQITLLSGFGCLFNVDSLIGDINVATPVSAGFGHPKQRNIERSRISLVANFDRVRSQFTHSVWLRIATRKCSFEEGYTLVPNTCLRARQYGREKCKPSFFRIQMEKSPDFSLSKIPLHANHHISIHLTKLI